MIMLLLYKGQKITLFMQRKFSTLIILVDYSRKVLGVRNSNLIDIHLSGDKWVVIIYSRTDLSLCQQS